MKPKKTTKSGSVSMWASFSPDTAAIIKRLSDVEGRSWGRQVAKLCEEAIEQRAARDLIASGK